MRALSLHSQLARLCHSCLYRSSGIRQEFSFFFYNFGFKALTLVPRNRLFDSLLRVVCLPIPNEFPAVHNSIIRHRDSLVAPLRFVRAGAEPLDLLGELGHQFGELRPLGRRYPRQFESFLLNSEILEHECDGLRPPFGLEISFLVVAIAGVASTHDHAVRAFRQSFDHQVRMHHSRTHHPDDPYVRRVLATRYAGQVRARIGTPVASQRNNDRLKLRLHRQAHGHTTSSAAATCAASCSGLKPLTTMPPLGQVAWHVPQPLHRLSFTSMVFLKDPPLTYSIRVSAL